MKLVLSPTKTMADASPEMGGLPPISEDQPGKPVFESEALGLNRQLARMDRQEILALFKTSEALTLKILDQIRDFKAAPRIPALFAFKGEAFKTLDPRTFSKEDLAFARDHLRIFSGLYGILSPMDGVKPYRLDAGTPLKQGRKSLRLFWKEKLGPWFKAFLEPDDILVNLASEEYASLLRGAGLEEQILTLQFREQDGEKLKNIPVRAKQARGLFARALIRKRIQDPGGLKALSPGGYLYSAAHSTAREWVFIRPKDAAA